MCEEQGWEGAWNEVVSPFPKTTATSKHVIFFTTEIAFGITQKKTPLYAAISLPGKYFKSLLQLWLYFLCAPFSEQYHRCISSNAQGFETDT